MGAPAWALLGFAMWTLALLLFTVGVYRWGRIFTGRVAIRDFPADAAGGEEWYRRATRAHANCIENLPVFCAVVFCLHLAHVSGLLVDVLAVTVLAARIVQSLVHVCFVHTNRVASVRFGFYFVQFVCFVWMAALAAASA
jgi:uncharacterized MAPEG superfamily protein